MTDNPHTPTILPSGIEPRVCIKHAGVWALGLELFWTL